MLINIFLAINMKRHLNYSKKDPKYILLEKIFKIIGFRKSRTIIMKNLKKRRIIRKGNTINTLKGITQKTTKLETIQINTWKN